MLGSPGGGRPRRTALIASHIGGAVRVGGTVAVSSGSRTREPYSRDTR